jgi:hypothetical protein
MSRYPPDPEGDKMAAAIKAKWAHRIQRCPDCKAKVIPLRISGGIRDLIIYVDYGSRPEQAQAWHTTYKPEKHREHECPAGTPTGPR